MTHAGAWRTTSHCRAILAALVLLTTLSGCRFVPDVHRVPNVRNPFPQLSRVAVVEFFNGTTDDSVIDGLEFAIAYSHQLQAIPGYEVVPPDVVRGQIRRLQMEPRDLGLPGNRRKLADALGVDAIVTGIVTEFSPYYPPRLGMQVDWYAANPCFHPIPPGYGLPWGTTAEEDIPESIVYEAELALAKAQLKTQTPDPPLTPEQRAGDAIFASNGAGDASKQTDDAKLESIDGEPIATGNGKLPADWPDPRGLVPHGPSTTQPQCIETNEPVMTHIRVYDGHDAQFTAALRNYYAFRDDARFGGWQSYLQRSSDFIGFCCHLHLSEMLVARGGAGKTRLAWRWSEYR
jgi:hypothetical protein